MNTIQSSYDSTSGLTRLIAYPVYHIESICKDESEVMGRLYLKSHAGIEIPVEVPNQFNWVESMKETDGGDVYEETITGYVRCEDERNRLLIRRLEVGLWIILIVDCNNVVRCVGSQEFPVRIHTERNMKLSNGVALEMSSKQVSPAFIVTNELRL